MPLPFLQSNRNIFASSSKPMLDSFQCNHRIMVFMIQRYISYGRKLFSLQCNGNFSPLAPTETTFSRRVFLAPEFTNIANFFILPKLLLSPDRRPRPYSQRSFIFKNMVNFRTVIPHSVAVTTSDNSKSSQYTGLMLSDDLLVFVKERLASVIIRTFRFGLCWGMRLFICGEGEIDSRQLGKY